MSIQRTGYIPVIIAAALIITGLSLFSDFGISWDEPVQREYGRMVYEYVREGNEEMLADRHRVYGPAFELLLYSAERGLGLEDSRNVYLMRHLVTFIMFAVGVAFFYLLASRIFESYKMGMVGAILLVVSPRIFAHAFYNSKDIPFMAMFIVCMYTLVRCMKSKSHYMTLVHGACCAALVDIRIMGVFVVVLTAGYYVYRMVTGQGRASGAAIRLAAFCGAFVPLTILMWPTLWKDTVGNFIFAFNAMRRFGWNATVLFMGKEVWSTDLPPYYTAVWILITLPVMYVVLSIAGLVGSIIQLSGRVRAAAVARSDVLLVLVWLVMPLVFLVGSGAVLYDTWRHTFFVYPAIVILALIGLRWLVREALGRIRGLPGKVTALALVLALFANISGAVLFMIRSHPHECVYFNSLVGGVKGAAGKYDMDYWGLSYRKLLESLLERDGRAGVAVHALNEPGFYNSYILPATARKRLCYTGAVGSADYYLTNFRWEAHRPPAELEFVSVAVDGVKLSASYRINRPK